MLPLPFEVTVAEQKPLDRIKDQLESVRRELDTLTKRASFADEVEAVTSRHARLRAVGDELGRIRSRGWAWAADLESTFGDLRDRANKLATEIREESGAAGRRVQSRLEGLANQVRRTIPALNAADDIARL